jgi:hypothetical protein
MGRSFDHIAVRILIGDYGKASLLNAQNDVLLPPIPVVPAVLYHSIAIIAVFGKVDVA